MYGDASDPDFPGSLPLHGVQWAIIAMPPGVSGLTHEDARIVLTDGLRKAGFEGRIAVRSHDNVDADRLRAHGADVVLSPFADAAVRAGEITGFRPVKGFDTEAHAGMPASSENPPLQPVLPQRLSSSDGQP
jgi:hypothetical protein